jgi:hypothetical protein
LCVHLYLRCLFGADGLGITLDLPLLFDLLNILLDIVFWTFIDILMIFVFHLCFNLPLDFLLLQFQLPFFLLAKLLKFVAYIAISIQALGYKHIHTLHLFHAFPTHLDLFLGFLCFLFDIFFSFILEHLPLIVIVLIASLIIFYRVKLL